MSGTYSPVLAPNRHPYDFNQSYVEYSGNEDSLRSFVDVEFLFETNIPGTQIFGGIAEQVRGAVDLNPQVTRDTQLRDLNGGAGIGSGAIEIIYTDGSNNSSVSLVDLSSAATIDDVARLIERDAPAGSGIRAEVTSTGLTLSTATGAEGVQVKEVAEGRTARDLGLLQSASQPALVGDDISPALLKTTQLSDLLGTKAQAAIVSTGGNNDLLITANQNGSRVDPSDALSDPLNGVTVQLVGGGVQGSESALYDPVAGTLTVTIEAGQSTAEQVAAAINSETSGLFNAQVDARDATQPSLAGQGAVDLSATSVTSGGSGEALDQSSGLKVTNGGDTVTIDISAAETVEDLLNILNQSELGLQTEINPAKNGINIRSRLSGADLTIGEVRWRKNSDAIGSAFPDRSHSHRRLQSWRGSFSRRGGGVHHRTDHCRPTDHLHH